MYKKRWYANRTRNSEMDAVSVAPEPMLVTALILGWKASAVTNDYANWLMSAMESHWKRTSWPARIHHISNRFTKSPFTCPIQKKVSHMAAKSAFCLQKLNRKTAANRDSWNSREIHCKYLWCIEIHFTKHEIYFSDRFNSYFEPGYDYAAVVSGIETGIPKSATLHWDYKTNFLNPLTWRVKSPRIYIKYIEVESLEHSSR